jgi:hypothetical protein
MLDDSAFSKRYHFCSNRKASKMFILSVTESMSALMRVAAPIASGVEMAPLKLRFEYPDLAVVVLLSNHQNVFL